MLAVDILIGILGGFAVICCQALGIAQGLLFFGIQLVNIVAMLIGLVLLIPMCLFHLWTKPKYPSNNPTKGLHDLWILPINFVSGNPEEGVSGKQALIWDDSNPPKQVPYMPGNPNWGKVRTWLYDAWRAYCWSALRNSTDNLKYVFANPKGKMESVTWKAFGKTLTFSMGWKPENGKVVPVISIG